MAFFQNLSMFTLLLLIVTIPYAKAVTFEVRNNCGFTVWAAAVPGSGRRLDRGQTWSFNVNAGTTGARIWARTGCNFNGGGRGRCLTLEGFNVPMEFSPTSNGCSRGIKCTADMNSQCPNELRVPGGCHNPCTVFNTDEYCCNSGNCGPTNYSRYFKDRCSDAYSYPQDEQTSNFTCGGGTNYKVVFLSIEEDVESCCSRAVSSSQAHSRHQRQKLKVYNKVLKRICESNFDESMLPGFDDKLWLHFNCLTARY
ncbi:hypothetical protein FNV43_RR09241 [Rhamnella rubrinervis]|uniref:Uncharacterized protein n=1 Tax=Rhamnella rubrinervis TaxID=2594499 RepID=A0A8K0HAY9_9ROSA|nr:hypothetical protein FNV43_RR09241 [Rhamnella rubrinervis]